MLTKLWFDLYGRGGTSGSSSAFEHVFVGEIKQCGGEEVTGFHNWLQFQWNGVLKAVSTTLIGVSPEFEIALYTLCFFGGEKDNHVQLGPYSVNIKCYRFGDKISSVFPIA
ncbi:26S proteasome regulatory subunit family protein [Hibiscus syriacus]|uniref:26S proteasome regulatory subunit family protein n=1 Tax=Hibiscus syriacus TaxID=106335 RepID=A0A6A2Y1X1_HIBSY|nr:26S proteasome regulatory subunit family protein [Hibiscus syriacus]